MHVGIIDLVQIYPEQAAIMFRIAKCCSRCGDKTGAVAALERLLYNHNFWDENYRLAGLTVSLWRTLFALKISECREDLPVGQIFAFAFDRR